MGFNFSDSGLLGGVMGGLFGGKTGAENDLQSLSKAYYGGNLIQRFLPPSLRMGATEPILGAGVQGLGGLIQNPGGINPNVADAIRPFLASQSQQIAQNFRNMQSQNVGNAARGNAPVSIKNAMSSALDVAQERAQREARMGAIGQSEQLRRTDLEQTYKLLDTILQFISSGRGQGIPGLASAAGIGQQRQASQMQFISSLLGNLTGAGMMGG